MRKKWNSSPLVLLLLLVPVLSACGVTKKPELSNTKMEALDIIQLTDSVFQHTSYLEVSGYGRVPCNGLIFFSGNKAIIFDTPVDDDASESLINWVQEVHHKRIVAVVVHHFHNDCLGGLNTFHQQAIPSYAFAKTIALAQDKNEPIPMHGFEDSLVLKIGNQTVLVKYFGPGHTEDNVVSYLPSAGVLFGGCLVKETGGGKGNLADANEIAWPGTVQSVLDTFPQAQIVVPGHGKAGGKELLEYTINLFAQE